MAQDTTKSFNWIKRVNVWAKGPLLEQRLGDPSNGLNDPPVEKMNWHAAFRTPPNSALSVLFLWIAYNR